MITLNLISPEKKREIWLAEVYIEMKSIIAIVLLIAIGVAISLLASKFILQNTFNKIVAETTLTTRYGNVFGSEIKVFNQQLGAIKNIQKKYIPWTNFTIQLVELVPKDTLISNITLNLDDKNGDKVIISGIAQNRDQLLEFKDNLENSTLFDKINIPLENLLKKDDVNFDIKAGVNIKNLNQ